MFPIRFFVVGLFVVGLAACAPSPGTADPNGFAGAAGAAGSGGNTGCLTFETQACDCAGIAGARVCVTGVWGRCSCEDGPVVDNGPGGDPASNKRGDIRWDWTPTAPMGGCRPGHYEGSFEGLYSSSLTFVGAAIPVFALDGTGMPGLEFDLVPGAGGGEILSVSGGKMRGTANGLFPFQFDIVGNLDCGTRKFDAQLVNGFYNVGPIMIGMEGPLTADYDPVTGSMVNGKWVVIEPNPPNQPLTPNFAGGWYGGAGDWRASYVGP